MKKHIFFFSAIVITSYSIHYTKLYDETIGDYAFGNNNLVVFNIPASVAGIGAGAFSYNLFTQVSIPATVINVESYAFWSNNITDITIPGSVLFVITSYSIHYTKLYEPMNCLHIRLLPFC